MHYVWNNSLGGYSMICPGTGILSPPVATTTVGLANLTWYSSTADGTAQFLIDRREGFRAELLRLGLSPEETQARLNAFRWDILPNGRKYSETFPSPPQGLRIDPTVEDPEQLHPEALKVVAVGSVVKKTRPVFTLSKPKFLPDGNDSVTITFSKFLSPMYIHVTPGGSFQLTEVDYTIVLKSDAPQKFCFRSTDPENWFSPFSIEATNA